MKPTYAEMCAASHSDPERPTMPERFKATAELISELKSALERLLACSEPTGDDTETDRAMEQARKALSKAQGKP